MPDSTAQIRLVDCDTCGKRDFRPLFAKQSERGETFQIIECRHCKLVQVNPQPNLAAVAPYYENTYFNKRTDRGYNNYFSKPVKDQINRVYNMNLVDLGFDAWEKKLFPEQNHSKPAKPRSLDVGCAAGYFVEHMAQRGWQAQGVELSGHAARYGIDELGLDILVDDFLASRALQVESYDMLSFWASIEHMHSPRRVFERCFELLRPGGRLILSTCRWGILAKWKGQDWRFMNVPEHLYFFSLPAIQKLARQTGFETIAGISYGSGLTSKSDASLGYRLLKKVADPLVKFFGQGDMMALHLQKKHLS